MRLASQWKRFAQIPRSDIIQVCPENDVQRRSIQSGWDLQRADGKEYQTKPPLPAEYVAHAGEVQDDLEEGEVRWHLRHHGDGQEQDRKE